MYSFINIISSEQKAVIFNLAKELEKKYEIRSEDSAVDIQIHNLRTNNNIQEKKDYEHESISENVGTTKIQKFKTKKCGQTVEIN